MDEWAALLAIVAAIFFALAATLWQKATVSLVGVSLRHPAGLRRVVTERIWLLGLVAQGVGVALQAAALDRGRVSIIQPLLVTSVIWALPLGYLMTGQRITRRLVNGAVIIVAGLAIFAAFADPAGGVDEAPVSDWTAPILVISGICASLLLVANRGSLTVRAATLGTLAGVLYGLAATLMKPVVETLSADGTGAMLAGWEFWAMTAAGLVGFAVQQLSLSTGRLVPSVATVSVANPVISVMLGAIVLQETLDRDPEWHAAVGVGGLALALFGAVMIATTEETSEAGPPREQAAHATS